MAVWRIAEDETALGLPRRSRHRSIAALSLPARSHLLLDALARELAKIPAQPDDVGSSGAGVGLRRRQRPAIDVVADDERAGTGEERRWLLGAALGPGKDRQAQVRRGMRR